jgi:hypothetical protein
MAFSFPYPTLAATPRPPGQGCKACVHRTYCPALYWFARYGVEKRTIDDHNGVQCASWSNNPADQVKTTGTQTDLEEVEYIYNQGIGSEPDRNGLSDQVTATSRLP